MKYLFCPSCGNVESRPSDDDDGCCEECYDGLIDANTDEEFESAMQTMLNGVVSEVTDDHNEFKNDIWARLNTLKEKHQ